jgi:hypothetical protein
MFSSKTSKFRSSGKEHGVIEDAGEVIGVNDMAVEEGSVDACGDAGNDGN